MLNATFIHSLKEHFSGACSPLSTASGWLAPAQCSSSAKNVWEAHGRTSQSLLCEQPWGHGGAVLCCPLARPGDTPLWGPASYQTSLRFPKCLSSAPPSTTGPAVLDEKCSLRTDGRLRASRDAHILTQVGSPVQTSPQAAHHTPICTSPPSLHLSPNRFDVAHLSPV